MAHEQAQSEDSGETAVLEGISVRLETATLGKRIMALSIDCGIISAFLYLAVLLFMLVAVTLFIFFSLGEAGSHGSADNIRAWAFPVFMALAGISLLIALLLTPPLYFIYYEYSRGQTPGKRVMGLRVVNLNGERASLGQCALREAARLVDVLMLFPGAISILLTKRRQRLGDILARTLVLYSHRDDSNRRSIYIDYDRFMALRATVRVGAIPAEWRRSFLPFAYTRLISQPISETTSPEDQEWLTRISTGLGCEFPERISSLERLRYIAELCAHPSSEELSIVDGAPATSPVHTSPGDLTDEPGASPSREYGPGGAIVRLYANIVDAFVAGMFAGLLTLPLQAVLAIALFDEPVLLYWTNLVLSFSVSFVVSCFYYAFFYPRYGAAPGKMLFNLRVIDVRTGTYPTWGRAVMRETLGKLASLLVLGVGLLMVPFHPRKLGLHDLLYSTQVVRERRRRTLQTREPSL